MEKEYIEMMIKGLEANLVEVTSFGDEASRKSIEIQIEMYRNRLAQL